MRILLMLAGVSVLAGCTQVPEDGGFAEVSTLIKAHGAPEVVWQRDAALSAQARAKAAAILAAPLTPTSAVAVALLQNPALQAQMETIGLANADLLSASRPANPVTDFAIRLPVSGPDSGGAADIDIGIVANLLSLLTMPSRIEAAQDALAVARLQTAHAIVAQVQDVKEAAALFDAARQALAAAQDRQAVADAALSYAKALYEAGNISAGQMLDHETAAVDAVLGVEDQAQRRREAELHLRQVMGLTAAEPVTWWPAPHHLTLALLAPDAADELIAAALAQRLDLQAQARAMEWRAKRAGYTVRWAAWDEAYVGLQAERGGGWAVGPALSVSLPVFHRGGAEVDAANAALRQARQMYAAAAHTITVETAAAVTAFEAAHGKAQRIAGRLLPLAEESLALQKREHDFMLKGTFDLLAARQRLGEVRQSLWLAQSEMLVAYIRLERAMGGSVPAHFLRNSEPPSAPSAAEAHQQHHH